MSIKKIQSNAKISAAFAMLLLGSMAITGCDQNDGSMEKMGKNIDEAATDMGNDVEDACEDVKESVNAEDKNC